jgi:pimeloyl-ACP methyl ester carboxylesterase
MKPFYFGRSRHALYGVLHEAGGPRRLPGVVVCSPFGQEAMRAHRSLRELAARLAALGCPVLRFDYRGSGDSGGDLEDARLEGWVEDALAAVDEMREATGESKVALAGLRLGGAVAALAARLVGGVDALVLWEPVVDGSAHLAELRAAHAAWLRDHAPGAALSLEEVLGFPLPPGLAADLAALRLDALEVVPARRVLVIAGDGQAGASLWPGQSAVEHQTGPTAPVWLHSEGMSRVLVPRALLDGVVTWLTGGAG